MKLLEILIIIIIIIIKIKKLPVAVVVDLVAEVVEAEPAAGSVAAEPLEVETFWLLFLPESYERLLLWDARLVGCWPGFVLPSLIN